jgi:hypothetical protein
MAGRLRTASNPLSTFILSAVYFFLVIGSIFRKKEGPWRKEFHITLEVHFPEVIVPNFADFFKENLKKKWSFLIKKIT